MKKILVSALLLAVKVGFSQTLLEDQFQFNHLPLNPALTGAKDNFSLNAGMGSQFNGTIRPQPIYQLFSVDGSFGRSGQNAIGVQAFNSNAAGFNNSGVKASYAYRYKVGELATVALGVDGGIVYQPIVSNAGGVGQLLPYAGVGGLLNTSRMFVSISKPIAYMKEEGFYGMKKPLYSMLGVSLGEYTSTMFNISALLETNKGAGSSYYLTGKAWFNRKTGIGVSYRSQALGNNRQGKLIAMLERQFSESLRLSLSYDPKPYQPYQQSINYVQRGVLQLFIRYDFLRDDEEEIANRMKYY